VLRGHLGMERVDWTDLEDLYAVLNGRICTVRQFVALLGVNPREFLEIQRRCRIVAVELAAALVFLKTYVVSDVGAVIFGVSTSTYARRANAGIDALAAAMPTVVRFDVVGHPCR